MAKYAVSLRGGFSDRNKIREENTTIQTTAFDIRTRTALINITDIIIQGCFDDITYAHVSNRHNTSQMFMRSILADVYSRVVDWSGLYHYSTVFEIVKDTLANDVYDAVLTVIEYIAENAHGSVLYKGKFHKADALYNLIFEQEYVGYRLINGQARPITDENEVRTIQETVDTKYSEVNQHIGKALNFLSDRQAPDYANSIKESISAVERMCSIIIGKNTTLNDALKKLEDNGVVIHAALKRAFSQLYGYTSDASGIRHAGELGGADSTFEEAKFMLVSCCAFVNYLTGLMAKCN